jgi:phage FluMu gp28-like protein
MSTLVEIESAVETLPQQDQRSLLVWLQSRLPAKTEPQVPSSGDRKQWLAELAELRARSSNRTTGVPLQEMMDSIREERY